MNKWATAGIFCVSLWLRAQYPAYGIWAAYDDQLFVRMAASMGMGEWLGPYDALTHAKGMFYSLFILVNHVVGLPLKIAEHLVYLFAGLFAVRGIARLTGEKWLALPLFAMLAFYPYAWTVPAARIVREGLYISLSLCVFVLWAAWFAQARVAWRFGLAVGAVSAAFWLTREEGVWLVPALAVLALSWAVGEAKSSPAGDRRQRLRHLARGAAYRVGLPIAFAAIFVGLVAALNYVHYDIFRVNDLRAGTPFARAYAALARIEHDQWRRYVIFPADARRRAYAVSPAVRELKPFFEGERGQFWVNVSQGYPAPWGCVDTGARCNDEILSGWFAWALRDAVWRAGYYRDAASTDHYYKRITKEINKACDQGLLSCHGIGKGLTPVWRDHYAWDALVASMSVLDTLVHFADHPLGGATTILTPEQRWLFEVATNSQFDTVPEHRAAPEGTIRRDNARLAMSEAIAWIYRLTVPMLAVVAVLAYAALMVIAWRGRAVRFSATSVALLTGLGVAVATRVGLLGFLEATSIPSNNVLYLSPALPFFLLFIALAPSLAVAETWRGIRRWRKGPDKTVGA